MNENLQLITAIRLAVLAHDDQMNKDGTPYILHPLRLMMAAKNTVDQAVAILHDTIEDTDLTIADLYKAGMSGEVVDAVIALTKKDGEAYEDAIERVALNPIATRVKLLDLRDNIDVTRLLELGDWELKRTAKYWRAIKRLEEVQNAN